MKVRSVSFSSSHTVDFFELLPAFRLTQPTKAAFCRWKVPSPSPVCRKRNLGCFSPSLFVLLK